MIQGERASNVQEEEQAVTTTMENKRITFEGSLEWIQGRN